MRKLASIQEISELRPIEGADAIEVAKVLGWNVVVKKGEFNVGDYVVYCEVDSVLPDRPEFEFLRSKNFRIRTIKLRGQISSGIVFPLDILPGDYFSGISMSGVYYYSGPTLGEDVTEVLGITKYEPVIPAQLSGKVRGSFPAFLRKTDETRIQSIPEVLDEHKNSTFYVTEKLDGCLDGDTFIETEFFGYMTIRDICESKYSGRILSYNHDLEQYAYSEIINHRILEDVSAEWFEICLDNGDKITVTGNHPIWIEDLHCYRRADEICIGQVVLDRKIS